MLFIFVNKLRMHPFFAFLPLLNVFFSSTFFRMVRVHITLKCVLRLTFAFVIFMRQMIGSINPNCHNIWSSKFIFHYGKSSKRPLFVYTNFGSTFPAQQDTLVSATVIRFRSDLLPSRVSNAIIPFYTFLIKKSWLLLIRIIFRQTTRRKQMRLKRQGAPHSAAATWASCSARK